MPGEVNEVDQQRQDQGLNSARRQHGMAWRWQSPAKHQTVNVSLGA